MFHESVTPVLIIVVAVTGLTVEINFLCLMKIHGVNIEYNVRDAMWCIGSYGSQCEMIKRGWMLNSITYE